RGLLVHAAGAAGRVRLARPGRRPGRLLPAQPEFRFQRRGDSSGRRLPGRAGRGRASCQIGGFMKKLIFISLLIASCAANAVTLKWAAQNDILTLDPHSQNHSTTHSILQYTYEGLTRYTRDYKIEPALATGWKQLSDTQWRFTLRKGVKFHD